MAVSRHRLAETLARRLLAGADRQKFATEVAAYLMQERRTGQLNSLLRDIDAYRAEQGIVEVVATTARPLNDAVRADVTNEVRKRFPEAKEILISEQHDATVVGGVRIGFVGQQLDLSVRSKLNQLKQLTGI